MIWQGSWTEAVSISTYVWNNANKAKK
jgi:hypothetical protein